LAVGTTVSIVLQVALFAIPVLSVLIEALLFLRYILSILICVLLYFVLSGQSPVVSNACNSCVFCLNSGLFYQSVSFLISIVLSLTEVRLFRTDLL
jgi:hypothetical protein